MTAPPAKASPGRVDDGGVAAAAEKAKFTPAMAQWFEAKTGCGDALLFFRMGDFYELFFEDAEIASRALDIQLTARGVHEAKPIRMCGVPVHNAEVYIARLIRKGFRVAIAEQTETAEGRAPEAKGPLRRSVVRIVTPGTLTEEHLLDPLQTQFLVALVPEGPRVGFAWCDASTSRLGVTEAECGDVPTLLARFQPAEILAPSEFALGFWAERRSTIFDDGAGLRKIARRLDQVTLVYEDETPLSEPERQAAERICEYLAATLGGQGQKICLYARRSVLGEMEIDPATRAALELTANRTVAGGLSIVSTCNETLTAAGARLLEQRLIAPSCELATIHARQEAWLWLHGNMACSGRVRGLLREAPDLKRALNRIASGRGTPRDLANVRDGMRAASAIHDVLSGYPDGPALCRDIAEAVRIDAGLLDRLAQALVERPPARLGDVAAIASGYSAALDQLRSSLAGAQRDLADLQKTLSERYGVAALKVKHHQQLGYVFEVPLAAAERIKSCQGAIHRQSTVTAARFTDATLSALNASVENAGSNILALETALLADLSAHVVSERERLDRAGDGLAELDVVQSHARLMERGDWCRPRVDDSCAFSIEAGRHPMVERALAGGGRFIANDCDLSPRRRLMLLTAPNMSGKSTFLRQTAVLAIMAQAGMPVPARGAHIGLVDKVFCRVGTSDDLTKAQSTFMAEMVETAAILRHATPRSLILVDELGRGTSTLDGLAIAWATLEYIHNVVRSRAIFATHFHELTRLRHELPCIACATMRIKEWQGTIVFLHEVTEGASGRSWGVEVAKLAGVPDAVFRRAKEILLVLEERSSTLVQSFELPLLNFATSRMPEPERDYRPLLDMIDALDPDKLSPREALDTLYAIKSLCHTGAVVAKGP